MRIIIQLDDKIELSVLHDSIKLSNLINCMELEEGAIIPIPNIDINTFTNIIEYCKHYSNKNPQLIDNTKINESDNIYSRICNQWDIDFIKLLSFDEVSKLVMGALFLDIESLILLGTFHMAILLKDLTTNEIRQRLQIENDFNTEEEHFLQNTIQNCCNDE